jgi:hypothetical protein
VLLCGVVLLCITAISPLTGGSTSGANKFIFSFSNLKRFALTEEKIFKYLKAKHEENSFEPVLLDGKVWDISR